MVPDSDILRYIWKSADTHDFAELELFIDGALNWIVNQMTRASEAKKDALQRKKPGAV